MTITSKYKFLLLTAPIYILHRRKATKTVAFKNEHTGQIEHCKSKRHLTMHILSNVDYCIKWCTTNVDSKGFYIWNKLTFMRKNRKSKCANFDKKEKLKVPPNNAKC